MTAMSAHSEAAESGFAGVAAGRPFTVLDPEPPGGLTVFELDSQGRYREVARVCGDEKFTTEQPFPITIIPARLLDGLHP